MEPKCQSMWFFLKNEIRMNTIAEVTRERVKEELKYERNPARREALENLLTLGISPEAREENVEKALDALLKCECSQ